MLTKMYFEVAAYSDNNVEMFSEDVLDNLNFQELTNNEIQIEGAIVMELTDGRLIRIHDDLTALFQGLCFNGIAKLVADNSLAYVYTYMVSDSHVVLIPMANLVRILGEEIEAFTCEKNFFLKELFDCGSRFLKMLGLYGDKTKHLVDYLMPSALKAENLMKDGSAT